MVGQRMSYSIVASTSQPTPISETVERAAEGDPAYLVLFYAAAGLKGRS